jgi:hypothetical protein
MHEVRVDEAVLLFEIGVILRVAPPRVVRIVIVVRPLGLFAVVSDQNLDAKRVCMKCERANGAYKMVGELQAGQVGVGIFEIYDHKLLVLVCWQKQGGLSFGHHTHDVPVLRLWCDTVNFIPIF